MKHSETYRTSDFLTFVVLTLLQHPVISIDGQNPRRLFFSFEDTARLREDVRRLINQELRFEPTTFWAAERRCKQLIYGEGQS